MCEPTTISLAITAVSAVMSYVGQSQAASRQESAAQNEYNAKQAALNENAHQVNMKATDDMSQRAIQARIEAGKLQAVGAESGLGTGNIDRGSQQSQFNEGTDIAAIEGNRKNAIAQNTLDSQGLYASAQSKMNAIKQPSLIGAGLQIAGGVADYQTATNKPVNKTVNVAKD